MFEALGCCWIYECMAFILCLFVGYQRFLLRMEYSMKKYLEKILAFVWSE